MIVESEDIFGIQGPFIVAHALKEAQRNTPGAPTSGVFGIRGWCLGSCLDPVFAREVAEDIQAGILLRAHP